MTLRPRLVWMTTPDALITRLSEGRCDAAARNSASVAMSSRSTAWRAPSSTAVRTSSTASRAACTSARRGMRPSSALSRGSLSSSSIEGSERRSSRSDWFGMALPFSPVPKSRSFPPLPRPVSSGRRRGDMLVDQCHIRGIIPPCRRAPMHGSRLWSRSPRECAEGADRRRMHENPQYYGAKAG